MSATNPIALAVFCALFALVTFVGFLAARWRQGNLDELHEWGLGGRRFGTWVTWFLLGGDLYTAYTFMAVPALVFGAGALGFFALPYTVITYPFVLVVMPRLWSVTRKRGYITAADFVRGRFGSGSLALAIAVTGILATMPYIALQLVGIQVVLGAMGVQGDLPIVIAFVILARLHVPERPPCPGAHGRREIRHPLRDGPRGGDRHPHEARRLRQDLRGGAGAEAPPRGSEVSAGRFDLGAYTAYPTLALGSALALFLYPHSMTGVLSSSRRDVIRRNTAMLPAYSFLLALIAALGYMALAAGVDKNPAYTDGFKQYGTNFAVPALFLYAFPPWFVGFSFAAIAIGALVPAAIMSIAAANLFTRNVYREYLRPRCSGREESTVAKLVSLAVKFGALAFIVFLPQKVRDPAAAPRGCLDPSDSAGDRVRALHALAAPVGPARRLGRGHGPRHFHGLRAPVQGHGVPAARRCVDHPRLRGPLGPLREPRRGGRRERRPPRRGGRTRRRRYAAGGLRPGMTPCGANAPKRRAKCKSGRRIAPDAVVALST